MIKTKLILARFDKDSQLIEQREQEARSWLRHFIDLFYCHVSALTLAFNDITPAARTVNAMAAVGWKNGSFAVGAPPGAVFMCLPATTANLPEYNNNAPRLGDLIGIVVGTSNLAVTPTQNALQAQIAHGEGAGQLLYGGCELYGLTFANPNGQFTIRRYFTNVLGGGITVQEVGIYAHGVTGSYVGYSFCIARDVVAPGITVNNGEILRVTYVPQITV